MGVLLPPGASPQGFWELYGTKLIYAFIAYMIVRLVLWLWPMPTTRRVVIKKPPPPPKKEGFQPREETDDSWMRL
jgi:hypothetical protein